MKKVFVFGLSAYVLLSGTIAFAQTAPTFSASPASGSAPLTVSFSSALANAYSSNFYIINFGDGQSSSQTVGLSGVSHTYASAGTYTATLQSATNQCAGVTLPCTQPTPNFITVGTLSITVSSGTTNTTFTASPTSGTAPLTVTFTGSIPGTSYSLDFGDGSSPVNEVTNVDCAPGYPNCAANYVSTVNEPHVYSQPGTYTAKLYAYSPNSGQCSYDCYLAAATVTVSSGTVSQSGTFTASPTSGTAPLSVEFYTNATAAVSINFGDGQNGSLQRTTCAAPNNLGTPCALEAFHTYQSAGTYTATMFDSSGNTLGTATVTVSGAPNTQCPSGYTYINGVCYNYVYTQTPTTVTPSYYTGSGYATPAATPTVTGPTTTTANPSCPSYAGPLYRGARDTVANGPVLKLQLYLASVFGLNSNTIATGYFGPITQSYVMKFQAQNGIQTTGTVGPLTRAAIQNFCGH